MASRKQWSELSPAQHRAILVGAGIEIVITTVALVDLARRPRGQVRGPKSLWALAAFVQPLGPVTYLIVGRRRPRGPVLEA